MLPVPMHLFNAVCLATGVFNTVNALHHASCVCVYKV